MSDPLAPFIKIVSVYDDALDPEKWTPDVAAEYLADFDPKLPESCVKDGERLTWFCVTQLPGDVLSDQVDTVGANSQKFKITFLNCCHRVEASGGELLFAPDESELDPKKSKTPSAKWWKRMLDEFGSDTIYNVAGSIMKRARISKKRRGLLA